MNKKRGLVILGAGGHGRVCADIALRMNQWETVAFLDDDPDLRISMDIFVVGTVEEVERFIPEYDVFVAIGNKKLRQEFHSRLEQAGASLPVLCHPTAVIGQGVTVGSGTVICAGAIINPCTSIGKSCIINTGATVDHDCKIENFVHISPGVHIAGSVSVGAGCWLGIGSIISNNLSITTSCIIGAGAIVIADALRQGTYVGVPARKI